VAIPIFYLFFIRPQIKKQKEQKTFEESLEKGKEVVTSSGLIGKINKVQDEVINLQLDNKTYVKVLKSSISREMTEQYEESQSK
jgi:preprotein translocase subunit YajC